MLGARSKKLLELRQETNDTSEVKQNTRLHETHCWSIELLMDKCKRNTCIGGPFNTQHLEIRGSKKRCKGDSE